jgi:hypothetical protein
LPFSITRGFLFRLPPPPRHVIISNIMTTTTFSKRKNVTFDETILWYFEF